MKSVLLSALALLAAKYATAHYTFPDLVVGTTVIGADWQYIRETQNFDSQAPVTDVTSQLIRCYENNTAAQTQVYTVSAGSTVGFQADQEIYHPGYYDAYMTPVSDFGEDAGTGTTWFKIWEDPPTYTPGSTTLNYPQQNELQFTFTLPAALPSGNYLLRGSQIALHVASTFGGAQFYLACAQLTVTNGGSGTPGPLVAFPGVFTGYEPGILIDIYNIPTNYTGYPNPGPPVWPPIGGSSPTTSVGTTAKASTTTHTTSTVHTTTTTSTVHTTTSTVHTTTTTPHTTTTTPHTTTTSTAGGGGGTAAEYAQCGGIGWTGATACVSPYTCQVLNPYYSQCLS